MDSSMNNITTRKGRQRSSSWSNNITISNSLLETTVCSLPNTSIESLNTNELQYKINQIKEELQTANQEIESLNYENTTLKKELDKYKKLIGVYKNLGISETLTLRTPSTGKKRSNSIKLNTINVSTPKLQSSPITDLDKKTCQQMITKQTDDHKKLSKDDLKTRTTRNMSAKESLSLQTQKKILIMADNQGRTVQSLLQRLVGDDYYVTCMWKPGARLRDVLNSFKREILTLSKDDYIFIAGGSNDVNPREFQFNTMKWLESVTNTNVIFTEIPYNRFLNVKKLNYELKFICSKFNNVHYLDLDFERYIPKGIHFSLNLCRSWLREILRIDYTSKRITYYSTKNSDIPKTMVNNTTQTDFSDCIIHNTSNNSSHEQKTPQIIIKNKNIDSENCTTPVSLKNNIFFSYINT